MADEKLRLFTAVRVPRPQLEWLDGATIALKNVSGARWTSIDNQHVTLNFLGWVSSARLPEILAIVDRVATRHAPARVSIGELGAFPNDRRARVLWAGLVDSEELLSALAGDLADELRAVGYEPEDRPYVAHLTLARLKVPRSVTGLLTTPQDAPQPFDVDRITLYRSRLSSAGARYEVVHEAYLTGNPRSR